jgi:3-hexulose-6-phosphate synthase
MEREYTMKLQLAIDLLSVPDALALLHKVAPYVDVIELGTPLIKQEGLDVVTDIKAAYPEKLAFADMKTMDAGELEADLAFKAGADIMTVLGLAGDSTITGAVKAGKAHGKAVVADMIGVTDKPRRMKELKALGVSWVELHWVWMSRRRQGIRLRICWKWAEMLRFRFRLRVASIQSESKELNPPARRLRLRARQSMERRIRKSLRSVYGKESNTWDSANLL